MYKIIGNKIRAIRLIKSLSQEYISLKLKKSQAAYSKIERGETSINDKLLQEIALILEVTKEEILNYDPNNYLKVESLQRIEQSLAKLAKDIEEIKLILKT